MRKRFFSKILVLGLLLAISMGLYLFPKGDDNSTSVANPVLTYAKKDSQQATKYNFAITFNEQDKEITGNVLVEVQNQSDLQLEELYFHTFPNAFTDWRWEEASKPTSEGYLKIHKATVNQLEVFPHQNETLLKINLPVPLNPQEITQVQLFFEMKIPENGLRLNSINETIFLAQWYPMLAVLDEQGWHLDPYTTTGDPFFSELADYHLQLRIPKGYSVISTAIDQQKSESNEITLFQENVRDFALVITKDYDKITSETASGVVVNLYYLPEQQEVAGLLLGSSIEALEYFDTAFGAYPLPELDVVLANAGYGVAGMEYPGLVTANAIIRNRGKITPAYNVVAHEIAHQWWYSTVGNNQVIEPWLDEGLTSFSEYLYMEEVMKLQGIDSLMKDLKKYTDALAVKNNLNVLQPIYAYGELYGPFIYGRPAAMLWELKRQYGAAAVKKILQNYYQQYSFKVATTEDFIRVVNEVTAKDMTAFFKEWLYIK